MNFFLQFNKSTDILPFVANNNSDILVYYVNELNLKNKNEFGTKKVFINPADICDLTNEINEYFEYYTDCKFNVYKNYEYFDQNVLNKLHADWVSESYNTAKVDVKNKGLLEYFSDDNLYPPWNNVLSKINKMDHYNSLNTTIHRIESQFNTVRYDVGHWLQMDNPFPKNRCTNDACNFRLAFNHLGRTLYNKFITLDDKLEFNDENTYNELLGFVDISLFRPQTIPLSKEYSNWCKKLNRQPCGDFLNIGNLVDYKNRLTEYRQIVYNNRNNSFKIKIED